MPVACCSFIASDIGAILRQSPYVIMIWIHPLHVPEECDFISGLIFLMKHVVGDHVKGPQGHLNRYDHFYWPQSRETKNSVYLYHRSICPSVGCVLVWLSYYELGVGQNERKPHSHIFWMHPSYGSHKLGHFFNVFILARLELMASGNWIDVD